MINKWILEHFKSVNEKTTLEIAPLTIFAGANSSGKSTIIQSILLTAQTIQSQVHSRPVVLNGHIVRLGTFNDVISNSAKESNISIGFELFPSIKQDTPFSSLRGSFRYFPRELIETIKSINCNFCFSAKGEDKEREFLQLQPRLESCSIETKGEYEKNNLNEIVELKRTEESLASRMEKLKINSANNLKKDISCLEFEVISKPTDMHQFRHYASIPEKKNIVGSTLQHFLPSRFAVAYDVVEEQTRRTLDTLFNPERPTYYRVRPDEMPALTGEFSDSIKSILKDSITNTNSTSLNPMALVRKNNYEKAFEKLNKEFTPDNLKNTYKYLPTSVKQEFFRKIDEKRPDLYKMLKAGRSPEIDIAYIPLSDLTDVATEYVQLFFSNQVKYLGPLRDEPKSVYPLAGSIDPKDIGFKGENTAAVLEVHRNTQINYLPCSVFTNNNLSFKMDNKSLIEAVLDWLKYLGIAHDIHTKDRGKLGHELTVSTLGTEDLHDLTHVGVGVSQVLPILVQSLLSEPGSTLIFEQPELHLHPRVQTRLADFFVSMIMIGKQCIIETHSEYMINRLRYMAAVTNGENVSTDVILYFVEKEKGHSIYRPIRINKYGVIKDWPKGFFDENEENAAEILKAGIQKKQKEKNIGK